MARGEQHGGVNTDESGQWQEESRTGRSAGAKVVFQRRGAAGVCACAVGARGVQAWARGAGVSAPD